MVHYFYEGYKAYNYGESLFNNPYAVGSYAANQWVAGWRKAKANSKQ